MDQSQPRTEKTFERFQAHRARLKKLATRILKDEDDAEAIVQDAWLRLLREQADEIRSPGAWLTTVVTRLCLDHLRAERRDPLRGGSLDEAADVPDIGNATPEEQSIVADTVGAALLIVLDRLKPAERVAFVLHEVFDMPFSEIAGLIDKSEAAARQLASRARRQVRGSGEPASGDIARHSRLALKFLNAARSGDVKGLLQLLAPDAALRPDATAARLGPGGEIRTAKKVATFFVERGAAAAYIAMIDGAVGLIVAPADRLLLVLKPQFLGDRITIIDAIANPDALAVLDLSLLPQS